MKTLCIIPAKGKSNRIIGKNSREFLGRPVIEYSLGVAKSFGFEQVVVSSDCDAIGGIAAKHGALYYKRSPETCRDDSTIVEAVLEVLHNVRYDDDTVYVCVLYPVAPFVRFRDILHGFELMKTGKHHVVYPIFFARDAPERGLIVRDGAVCPRHPEYTETNSQYFKRTYHSAGQWYWAELDWLLNHKTLTPLEAGYVEIPQNLGIDIDTPDDWVLAEMLYIHEHFPAVSRDMLSRVTGILSTTKEAAGEEVELKSSITLTTPCGGANEASP